jgi:hypothetical protein
VALDHILSCNMRPAGLQLKLLYNATNQQVGGIRSHLELQTDAQDGPGRRSSTRRGSR